MTVAFVYDTVLPYVIGGNEERLKKISEGLIERGHRATVITNKFWKSPGKKININGVCFLGVNRPTQQLCRGSGRSISSCIIFGLKIFPALLTENYDLIESSQVPIFHLPIIWIIGKLRHKPIIFSWVEFWDRQYWKKYLGHFGLLADFFQRQMPRLPKYNLVISDHTKSNIKKIASHPAKMITIPPTYINLPDPKANPPKTIDCIYSGRLLNHKNIELIIRAFPAVLKSMPEASCLIIGEGPERAKLIKLSQKENISDKIHFQTFIGQKNKLHAKFASSKMYLSTSTREGFGISALEAMSLGVPVITIDHPQNATKDLVTHQENGLIISPNPQDLSRAIIELLSNPTLYQKLSANAQNRAKQFSKEGFLDKIESTYKNAIKTIS